MCSITLLIAINYPLSHSAHPVIKSYGYVKLPVTIKALTMLVPFVVTPSIKRCDMLLGLPYRLATQVIISMNHLCLKFIHNKQVITIKGVLPSHRSRSFLLRFPLHSLEHLGPLDLSNIRHNMILALLFTRNLLGLIGPLVRLISLGPPLGRHLHIGAHHLCLLLHNTSSVSFT